MMEEMSRCRRDLRPIVVNFITLSALEKFEKDGGKLAVLKRMA